MTTQEMQAHIVDGVRRAMSDLCSTMLGCEAEPGEVRVVAQPLEESEGVVALIGMAGPWIGTGAILCKPDMACKLAGAMLMSEYAEVDDEVLDAVAEVANMVIGNLKTSLEEMVGAMGLSTPTVIHGASFTTKLGGNHGWTLMPFAIMGGTVLVQVCLLPNVDGRTTPRLDIVGALAR